MTINKQKFFSGVRSSIFSGKLTSSQVAGAEAIIDGFEERKYSDLRWLAYMLATAYHETASTMQPITEYGGKKYFDKYDTGSLAKQLGNTPEADGDGYTWRGRGYVQLTGYRNYSVADQKLQLHGELIRNPDLALKDDIAAQIMLFGMTEGWFTGRKLSDYFSETTSAWGDARRIINGTDKASLIAGYGKTFYGALGSV